MANGLSDRKADKQELMEITEEAYEAASQLLAAARPKKGSILWLAVPPVKWAGSGSEAFPVRSLARHCSMAFTVL